MLTNTRTQSNTSLSARQVQVLFNVRQELSCFIYVSFNSSTRTHVFSVVADLSHGVGVANVSEGFSNRTFFNTAHIREPSFLNCCVL